MKPLTREQVRRVDQIAIEEFEIPGVVLMENAGRGATDEIERAPESQGKRYHIVCGPGNNGGDGFVIARHLLGRDHDISVTLVGDANRLAGDAAINHRILTHMGIPIASIASDQDIQSWAAQVGSDDVVIDALLGTGFRGDVREPMASLIRTIGELDLAGVVAIDLPSGLDCDRGTASNATIRAGLTVTFVAPKVGFARPEAAAWVGRVHTVDIGAPAVVVARVLE